ncbi:hypothetical protein Back2_05440 [Nocardioides baekrokdamisoli]|uniref:DUF4190 domain-containing protein n=1 Tax=Nocardioides baekrokdamisoli TaxID=1804624 RepID=A0A3G9IBM1_9ACTN|nr:DUF4190 domain-containing protein [Nocardioides baekrokdamisoli]BBH16257.1 hypothetical protein Back2_05440 [Nocardioides baekrokdamisoli]
MTNYPPPPPAPMYQPPTGYPQEHPRGTLILVFGILSIVCCGLFLGIPAWVMGSSALKDIDRSGVVYGNRGTVKAGMICGIIGTVLSALGILFYIVVIVIVGTTTGFHSTSGN